MSTTMTLVGYSDSEESDSDKHVSPSNEHQKGPSSAVGLNSTSSKLGFLKVVDRSNPHKIKVSLPGRQEDVGKGGDELEGPPAKRHKVDGGAFSDFNSFLPAPTRAVTAKTGVEASKTQKIGLGSGVSLKTGAAPGFSREPFAAPSEDMADESNMDTQFDSINHETGGPDRSTTQPKTAPPSNTATSEVPIEPIKKGNPIMFKPLSVARKPRKPTSTTSGNKSTKTTARQPEAAPTVQYVPKVSLFSMDGGEGVSHSPAIVGGSYQPVVYQEEFHEPAEEVRDIGLDTEDAYRDREAGLGTLQSEINDNGGTQSLDSIAADLNLSASAKRQLLGRQWNNKSGQSAVNVVNFNTDQEYASNELLRQSGEQIQHNPVRALAAGKHSLKQLINAASNQKDALEDSFASGRRNKKEAGSKYGW